MAFSKTFPKTTNKSVYPKWVEVFLTTEEEMDCEHKCKEENIRLMHECIEDAKKIVDKRDLKRYQTDLIRMAISLFEKRASHEVYWKENKAKEKFDLEN